MYVLQRWANIRKCLEAKAKANALDIVKNKIALPLRGSKTGLASGERQTGDYWWLLRWASEQSSIAQDAPCLYCPEKNHKPHSYITSRDSLKFSSRGGSWMSHVCEGASSGPYGPILLTRNGVSPRARLQYRVTWNLHAAEEECGVWMGSSQPLDYSQTRGGKLICCGSEHVRLLFSVFPWELWNLQSKIRTALMRTTDFLLRRCKTFPKKTGWWKLKVFYLRKSVYFKILTYN